MDRLHSRAISAPVTVIGIDCATQAQRVGLARGVWEGGALRLVEGVSGATVEPAMQVAAWVQDAPYRSLLCLDAPLGWPAALGESLASHQAGDALNPAPDELFHRYTDDCCRLRLRQHPMEVGADRIARTARAALELLRKVRRLTGLPIPLAWNPDHLQRASAIETYPAATLKVRGLPNRGYKRGRLARAAREALLAALADEWTMDADRDLLARNADVLDAALCVLTGADFLAGRCCPPPPDKTATVRREGWIWVLEEGGDAAAAAAQESARESADDAHERSE